MDSNYVPQSFESKDKPVLVKLSGGKATVQEGLENRTFDLPGQYFTIFNPSPFAIQLALMRYWENHGRPATIPVLRAKPGAAPIRIERAGREIITVKQKKVSLDRYTVANLMFGQEVVWMDQKHNLAAAMTFAGGLPMEAVRPEYEPALEQLYRSGVAQEMVNLQKLTRQVPIQNRNTFALVGARLVDGTGAAPVENSVVIVTKGRITAAGPRDTVVVPSEVPVVNVAGNTILPGLWEMHTHFSGVEFGPALLAAGITTARDCGGEFEYLIAQRDAVERQNALGPRLLLAGLVDAGGLKAFGSMIAETPEQGRAVVNRYHSAGFQQVKLYTYLAPDVVKAIDEEAHRLGMTVTGHVPRALNAFEGVQAGMDQINHLNYISNMMRTPGREREPIDVNSEQAKKAVQFFRDHHTVVDPTAGWGEMASHSKEVDVASFEPGIAYAPFVLDVKFRGMGGSVSITQMGSRTAQTLAVIGALHKGRVTIVPGSDTGLVGYGLLRELELYVQAGMTPMEAIQCATIVSARAIKLDHDSGTVEPGKRADLILVKGNPVENISDLRKVVQVVANGKLYNTADLRQSVGFLP